MTVRLSLKCIPVVLAVLGGLLLRAALLPPAVPAVAATRIIQPRAPFGHSPFSASMLMARAISGKQLPAGDSLADLLRPIQAPVLDCSPVPCAVNNQQASEGGEPVSDTPISANPDNLDQLLTGGMDYNCSQLAAFYFSRDGGSTWNVHCSDVLSSFPEGLGNPGVAFDLKNVAYITAAKSSASGAGVVAIQKSANQGSTWTTIRAAVIAALGGLVDKPWMAIDDTAASPRANAIYISSTQFNAAGTQSEIFVAHSTNGGNTFTNVAASPISTLPKVVQFSNLAAAADGTVYVAWLSCTANGPTGNCGGTKANLLFAKSTDGGATWSRQAVMASAQLAPDACSCAFYGSLPNTSEPMSDIPVLAVDNTPGSRGGTIYVAYYTWTGQFMQVNVISSSDGGAMWSAPAHPAPPSDTHDQFFPWISVSATSKAGVTWLDRRNDPANLLYESFSGNSSDGVHFSNLQLASEPSNPLNDGFGGTFLGDLAGNVWTQKTLYTTWPDTRTGVNAQNEAGGLRVH